MTGSGSSGSASFDIQFGYEGSYTAAPHGLVADAPTSGEIGQDPDQTYPSGDDSPVGVQKIDYRRQWRSVRQVVDGHSRR